MTQINNWYEKMVVLIGKQFTNDIDRMEALIKEVETLAKAEEKKRVVEIIKEYCLEQGVETYFLPELLKKID